MLCASASLSRLFSTLIILSDSSQLYPWWLCDPCPVRLVLFVVSPSSHFECCCDARVGVPTLPLVRFTSGRLCSKDSIIIFNLPFSCRRKSSSNRGSSLSSLS